MANLTALLNKLDWVLEDLLTILLNIINGAYKVKNIKLLKTVKLNIKLLKTVKNIKQSKT